jgi:hypothetical protein
MDEALSGLSLRRVELRLLTQGGAARMFAVPNRPKSSAGFRMCLFCDWVRYLSAFHNNVELR